jgi:hypothetical protein
MQVDILVVNNTEIPLALDLDQDCQRDCHHKGWQVTISRSQLPQVNKEILQVAAGKIVEGREPPERVRFILLVETFYLECCFRLMLFLMVSFLPLDEKERKWLQMERFTTRMRM